MLPDRISHTFGRLHTVNFNVRIRCLYCSTLPGSRSELDFRQNLEALLFHALSRVSIRGFLHPLQSGGSNNPHHLFYFTPARIWLLRALVKCLIILSISSRKVGCLLSRTIYFSVSGVSAGNEMSEVYHSALSIQCIRCFCRNLVA